MIQENKVLRIANIIYEKENRMTKHGILHQVVGLITSVIIICLFSNLWNYKVSLYMVLFYIYVRAFSTSNNVASRVLSKNISGIYENLLCSGLSLKEILNVEIVNALRKEMLSAFLSNVSIWLVFVIVNSTQLNNIFSVFLGITLTMPLSWLIHVIVYRFSVIRTIKKGNIGLLSLMGIGSGFCLLLDIRWCYKVVIIVFLLGILLLKTEYTVLKYKFEDSKG